MRKKKVLFISHNAGRTGAPLLLLNLLKWLKENANFSFDILLRGPGPLQRDFAALAPTFLYSRDESSGNLIARICQKIGLNDFSGIRHHQNLLNHFRNSGIKLIYSNTITNGDILETLAPLGCPVITHVHELNYWIEQSGEKNLQQVVKYSSRYIAGSRAVKDNLVSKCSLSPDRIDVVHDFIPAHNITSDPTGIRNKFGIPEESFVVLGSGHETWRKGKDLFVQLAAQVRKILPEVQTHFLWVGGWEKDEYRRNILHDVEKLGLTGQVHFTGSVSNTLNYFAAGNIFAMVSREDPFPLVCLEAASLARPVICFADSGGMPEFVENDAGFVVPYLNIDAMADRAIELIKDEKLRRRFGERAAQKVRERHDISVAAPKILKVIQRFLNQ